jgi:hypothetical protein
VNKVSNEWSLGKSIEVLKEFDSILDSGDVLESKSDDVLEVHLEVLNVLLEELSIIIMPLSLFNIKDFIGQSLDIGKVRLEGLLQFQDVVGVLLSESTTKDGHLLVLTLSGELKLSLTDLHEFSASLDESFILSEDGLIIVKSPVRSGTVLLDHLLVMHTNGLPLFTAVNGFLEVSHAFLNFVTEHVLDLDLLSATVDDLIRDLDQEGFHSFFGVVMSGEFPDYSDAV